MRKTTDDAVERLINAVKDAIEDGRASASDLELWLQAAVALEELAMDEAHETRESLMFGTWAGPLGTVH
ncbi:hypothetical protein BH10PSE3_BH10PSE3_12620 [soil metagenome]